MRVFKKRRSKNFKRSKKGQIKRGRQEKQQLITYSWSFGKSDQPKGRGW